MQDHDRGRVLAGEGETRRSRSPTFAAGAGRRLRRRPAALPPAARVPLGTDGDFSYDGIVARYNADLANNLGNLVSRVATWCIQVRRRRARPATGERAGRRGGGRARGGVGRLGRWAPHEALEETWRLIGAANASSRRPSPGRWSPVPRSTPCWATRSRRCGSWRSSIAPAMPATAVEVWRRIGVPGDPSTAAAARRRGLGRLSRAAPRGQGRSPVPAAQGLSVSGLVRLPLPRPGGVPRRGEPGGRRPGARSWRRAAEAGDRPVGLHRHRPRPPRPQALAVARRRAPAAGPVPSGLGLHRASPARGQRGRRRAWPRCWSASWPAATAPWWRWASAGSTTTTSTRRVTRSAPPSRRRSRWRTRTAWPSSSTRATRGTICSTCSRPRACRSAPCCTASPAVRPRSSVVCARACTCRSAAS